MLDPSNSGHYGHLMGTGGGAPGSNAKQKRPPICTSVLSVTTKLSLSFCHTLALAQCESSFLKSTWQPARLQPDMVKSMLQCELRKCTERVLVQVWATLALFLFGCSNRPLDDCLAMDRGQGLPFTCIKPLVKQKQQHKTTIRQKQPHTVDKQKFHLLAEWCWQTVQIPAVAPENIWH